MSELISGLGGAFVFSEEPARLAEWYADRFGFQFETFGEMGTWYQVLWSLDPEDPGKRLDTTFSIMPAKTALPRATRNENTADMYGDQHFMLNLRVRDLDTVLARLQERGDEILSRLDEDYGRFAWVFDPDGNRVELYQPAASD